jgi:hypothetical protein
MDKLARGLLHGASGCVVFGAFAHRNTSCNSQNAKPKRVLVTGFNDWRNLGDAGVWRCKENPSCRLLLGGASHKKPCSKRGDGKLVNFLRAKAAKHIYFDFVTMPTVWGTAVGSNLGFNRSDYDVVIHIGLGVYDCHDKILLERGAINKRCNSPDAGEI